MIKSPAALLPLFCFQSMDVLKVVSSLFLAIHGVIGLSAPFISSRRYRQEDSFLHYAHTTCYCNHRLVLIKMHTKVMS